MNDRIFRITRLILLAIALLTFALMILGGVDGNYSLYSFIIFLIAVIINLWQGIIIYPTKRKTAILLFVVSALLLAVALLNLTIT